MKGVAFAGAEDELVASGSDCGHLYLWDKVLFAKSSYCSCESGHRNSPSPACSTAMYAIARSLRTSVTQWAHQLRLRLGCAPVWSISFCLEWTLQLLLSHTSFCDGKGHHRTESEHQAAWLRRSRGGWCSSGTATRRCSTAWRATRTCRSLWRPQVRRPKVFYGEGARICASKVLCCHAVCMRSMTAFTSPSSALLSGSGRRRLVLASCSGYVLDT